MSAQQLLESLIPGVKDVIPAEERHIPFNGGGLTQKEKAGMTEARMRAGLSPVVDASVNSLLESVKAPANASVLSEASEVQAALAEEIKALRFTLEEAANVARETQALEKKLSRDPKIQKAVKEAVANDGYVQQKTLAGALWQGAKVGALVGGAVGAGWGALGALPLLLAGPVGGAAALGVAAISGAVGAASGAGLGAFVKGLMHGLRENREASYLAHKRHLGESVDAQELQEARAGQVYLGKTEAEVISKLARMIVRGAAVISKKMSKEDLKQVAKSGSAKNKVTQLVAKSV